MWCTYKLTSNTHTKCINHDDKNWYMYSNINYSCTTDLTININTNAIPNLLEITTTFE